MIVEIHGVDEERMKRFEDWLRAAGFVELTGYAQTISVSAGSGEARLVNTHRLVFCLTRHMRQALVFLREPGKLCVTIDGALGSEIKVMLHNLGISNVDTMRFFCGSFEEKK